MSTWVRTDDGVRLAVDVHRPPEPSDTAVVIAHGFTATRDHADVVSLAGALVEDGFCVFTYDSRGHGRSEGTCTLGDLERYDVAAVAALAAAESARVVLVGASMGAIAVLRYAAEVGDGLTGVVAVSSPSVWRMPWSPQGVASVALTRTRPGRSFLRRRAGVRLAPKWTRPSPPVELVARIAAPVAFIHGRRDRFIKPIAALELHRATPEHRRLDLVAEMGHAFDPVGIPAIRAAVAWTLSPGEHPAERTQPHHAPLTS